MARKELKAGIRFNDPDLKYTSLNFEADPENDTFICTIDAEIARFDPPITVRGVVQQWSPVEDEDAGSDPLLSVQPTRAAKTTAKKAVKESK